MGMMSCGRGLSQRIGLEKREGELPSLKRRTSRLQLRDLSRASWQLLLYFWSCDNPPYTVLCVMAADQASRTTPAGSALSRSFTTSSELGVHTQPPSTPLGELLTLLASRA